MQPLLFVVESAPVMCDCRNTLYAVPFFFNAAPPHTAERFVQQKGVDPAAPESIAHWLRMCAEGENPKFLASHTDEATVDIARSIAEKFTSMDPTVDSEHCCGVEAVAAMSSLLARAPVRLEPSPVPLLVIHGAGDQMVDAETVRTGVCCPIVLLRMEIRCIFMVNVRHLPLLLVVVQAC